MNTKLKIIIDTDIGDDIDDLFALMAAMVNKIEIVGITTVFRNTQERARMAKKLMKAYGKGYENVPVYAGYGTPYNETKQESDHLCQYTADLVEAQYTPLNTNPEDAVDFIISSCKKYGSELTVLAIGPFTNIAKVIEKDKNALNLANKVIIMGGAYFKQYADWNVMCDVTAADIMFRNLHNLECIGADVTHLLRAENEIVDYVSSYDGENSAFRYISELYNLWCNAGNKPHLVFHDVLVVYYAMNPEICTTQKASIAVICNGAAKGMTLNVDAYTKAYMNDWYKDQYHGNKSIVAKQVNSVTFNSSIKPDIIKCANGY